MVTAFHNRNRSPVARPRTLSHVRNNTEIKTRVEMARPMGARPLSTGGYIWPKMTIGIMMTPTTILAIKMPAPRGNDRARVARAKGGRALATSSMRSSRCSMLDFSVTIFPLTYFHSTLIECPLWLSPTRLQPSSSSSRTASRTTGEETMALTSSSEASLSM